MGQLGQIDFAELCGQSGHLLVETLEVAAETKPGDGLTPLCPFLAMP